MLGPKEPPLGHLSVDIFYGGKPKTSSSNLLDPFDKLNVNIALIFLSFHVVSVKTANSAYRPRAHLISWKI